MGEHTYLNLPWAVSKYSSVEDASGQTVEANGFATVCTFSDRQAEAKRRAAFIVTAVNSHSDLLAALHEALFWTDEENDVKDWRPAARAAIAKAEGSGQ